MGLAADATPKPPSATPLSEPLASLLPFRLPHPAFPGRDQTGAEVLVEPLPRQQDRPPAGRAGVTGSAQEESPLALEQYLPPSQVSLSCKVDAGLLPKPCVPR